MRVKAEEGDVSRYQEPKGCWKIQRQEGDLGLTGSQGLRIPLSWFQFKTPSLRQCFLSPLSTSCGLMTVVQSSQRRQEVPISQVRLCVLVISALR